MGRVDVTFRALTPDQVDALNACYRLLHEEDLAEHKADIQRAARGLAKELSKHVENGAALVPEEPAAPPFGAVFGGQASAPEPAPSAANPSQSAPQAPWETASIPNAAPQSPTPTPPAPPAPPATPPAPPQVRAAPAGAPVDVNGVPYNADVHAPLEGTTGGKQANGTWKRKRSASVDAYNAWRLQFMSDPGHAPKAPPAAPPAPPAAPPVDMNAQYGAPPVNNGAAPLPPAHVFFGSASSEPDLDQAPLVDEATFLNKARALSSSGTMTQAIAMQIMKHPKILANDNVDVGRDPDKRRKAFLLLTMLEAGTWPKAA